MPGIGFRRLQSADLPLLAVWQESPHVARWWRDPTDLASLEAQYGPTISGADPTEVYVVTADGDPIGMIQRYRLRDNPSWERALRIDDAAGIDYYIGREEFTGRGVGTTMLSEFSALILRDYSDIQRIVAAPQQDNVASWRALERAGYRRVWSGMLDSDDPSDGGPSYVYVLERHSH